MRSIRSSLPTGLVVALVVVGTAIWGSRAQDMGVRGAPQPGKATVDQALTRSFTFAFDRETTVTQVAQKLQADLGFQVVLDVAGLQRAGISPDDHVKLSVKDVRLKTGLKLLLDQLGLTFRAVPEDNLLIITDPQGADDATTRLLAEIKELHRDIHDLQDAVDDLSAAIAPAEGAPAIRKPTIIEEVPADEAMPEKKKDAPKDDGPAKDGDHPAGRFRPGL